jgi:hypothetical protein
LAYSEIPSVCLSVLFAKYQPVAIDLLMALAEASASWIDSAGVNKLLPIIAANGLVND